MEEAGLEIAACVFYMIGDQMLRGSGGRGKDRRDELSLLLISQAKAIFHDLGEELSLEGCGKLEKLVNSKQLSTETLDIKKRLTRFVEDLKERKDINKLSEEEIKRIISREVYKICGLYNIPLEGVGVEAEGSYVDAGGGSYIGVS